MHAALRQAALWVALVCGPLALSASAQDPAAPAGAAPASPSADAPLAADPSLLSGRLTNGLSYVVRRHGNPAGRISVWLHVSMGSFGESDETRGIAHFLEHMAFNGSENFPPGSVVPLFESLGMTFGRDQNAFTSYDQTTYQIALPDVQPATLAKGMLFLSDVAGRLRLTPAEIDAERQIILEEKRARSGAARRVQDLIDDRILPGSAYGRRAPIGAEATIRSVTPDQLRAFYGRWYVPSNMTVLAVGDCDPALVEAAIQEAFGKFPGGVRSAVPDLGITATKGQSAVVATDAELTVPEIALVRVVTDVPPTTTTATLRRELAETLGTRAFARKSQRVTLAGDVSFATAEATIRDTGNFLRQCRITARLSSAGWAKDLADLGAFVQRIRIHGFSERDLADEKLRMISDAETAVAQEATRPAGEIIRRMNTAVTFNEPIRSAQQRLDALRDLLPLISRQEVSACFAAAFDPADVVFVAQMPAAGRPVPTEAELLARGTAAFEVTPAPEVERPRPETLLGTLPEPGVVVEQDEHAASAVWSGWLGNGVRVHHRFMDVRKNEVTFAITLAGGAIFESGADRGIAAAACVAWQRQSAGKLTSMDVQDLLIGKKVGMAASVGEDTMNLSVSGEPGSIDAGLQVAHLLLTAPVLEPRAFGGWQQAQLQAVQARERTVLGGLQESFASVMLPSPEARMRPLDERALRRIQHLRAQGWLRCLVASAPLEIAIVGDLPRDRAVELARIYFGSLPARPRITQHRLDPFRRIAREPGPIDIVKPVAAATPEAVVLAGFFTAEPSSRRESRTLELAARILTTRMTKAIREEKQLVYSIQAVVRPVPAYPGWSTLAAQAPTDPARGDVLADAIDAQIDALAADGPSADELAVAQKQTATLLGEKLRDPQFWSGVLSTLDFRGESLADVLDAPALNSSITADEIRTTVAKWAVAENRFRFVVSPK